MAQAVAPKILSFPQVNIRQLKESLRENHRFRHGEDDAAKTAPVDYDVKDFSMHARSISSSAELGFRMFPTVRLGYQPRPYKANARDDPSFGGLWKLWPVHSRILLNPLVVAPDTVSTGENMLDEHFDLTAERVQERLGSILQALSRSSPAAAAAVALAAKFHLIFGQDVPAGLEWC